MMNKKITIAGILIILLLVLAYFAGYTIGKKKSGSNCPAGYDQGWSDAEKRFAKTCKLPTISDKEIKITDFHGKIIAVSEGKIIIESSPLGLNVSNKQITVRINSETQIKQTVLKTESEFNQELSDYNLKTKGVNQGPEPDIPLPLKFKQITVTEKILEINQGVSVSTISPINNTDEITAKEIIIDYSEIKK